MLYQNYYYNNYFSFAFIAKKSFYVYAFVLSILNLIQAIGSGLFYGQRMAGLCIVDVTTYVYFTLFTPFVYYTFLSAYLSSTQSVIMFSYKPQVDDGIDETADDTCSQSQLPHQLSCSSLKTDGDFVFQRNNALYESTQFAIQSPNESITSNHSIN